MVEQNGDVLQWLKSMPLAPEYRPTLSEFQDPIAFIFKIEKEASKYGICKIVPPLTPPSKKAAIANLTRSLSARADGSNSKPTFTTRQQQIGFCPRRARPVQRPVWQSGGHYTFQEFEAKAKAFEKSYLKKHRKGGAAGNLSALEAETLFWKATVDKPFSVEYANDMPGSAFSRRCRESSSSAAALAESAWNMREVSRANGSLLRFMKEEIPGVTSPMVYVAMLFSWFAWHVEDHDLHSLNYLHMGAGKTWYGVPREAAVAFEEVVRVHGYGGEINPLVTFSTLGEKTTVMSPEVLISAGVPCCRLVQNAGEFVVTFPRAYHSGFSHGFNIGEAANIATPEWLSVAKDAAIRRASINYPPMVSHFQLLYDLALSMCSRIPAGINAEPRSSRLKDKKRGEGEIVIKELFVEDVLHNNDLLHGLSKGSAVVLLPHSSFDISVCSKLRVWSQQPKAKPGFSLNAFNSEGMNISEGFVSDDLAFNRNHGIKQENGFYSVKDKFTSLYKKNGISSFDVNSKLCNSSSEPQQRETDEGDKLSDQRLFSCVTCGILSFSCVAIVQPRESTASNIMSADSRTLTDTHEDTTIAEPNMNAGWTENKTPNGLYDDPVHSDRFQLLTNNRNYEENLSTEGEKGNTALALLASAYGNSSDSEEDSGDPDIAVSGPESNSINTKSGRLPSHVQDSHASPMSRLDVGDGFSSQSFDHSFEKQDHDTASGLAFKNTLGMPNSAANCLKDVHDAEETLVKARIPIDNTNTSLVPQFDEDSSRMHVFCLEHATKAEQQLRQIGGAHIFILCHSDYPKIEAEAKHVAGDLGIDYVWKNIAYRHATKEDEERIQLALDSEEAIPGNGDWAVKLGINLFYSANLSRSPLYSKQMHYNPVIYYAFGRKLRESSPVEPKVYQRRANKQKKVVAGKWCGKVWMSSQVHPLLATRDSEDEVEKSLQGWISPNEQIERSESVPKSEISIRKLGKKRKMTVDSGRARKGSFTKKDIVSVKSTEDKLNRQPRRVLRSKQVRHVQRDGTSLEGDDSPSSHHRKSISKQTNCTESDAVSDDSRDDNYERQHNRHVHVDKDVFSNDTIDYDSDWQQLREVSSQQGVNIDRDAISDESLDGSLRLHGKHPNYIGEGANTDDQMEDHFHKQRKRIPKGRQCKNLSAKDVTSDDQLEQHMQNQEQRNPRSRQAKGLAGEAAISDDQMEGHYRKYRKTPKGRLAECLMGEDLMSDDQVEDHVQREQTRVPRRRQNKGIDTEVKGVMSDDDQLEDHCRKPKRSYPRSRQSKRISRKITDDMAENNSHLLNRTPRRKQAKCEDEDDYSDDEVEDDSHQQHQRILRRKQQSKPKTLKQLKQANPLEAKNQTSWPVQGAKTQMKSKGPRKTKQPLNARTKQSGNSREFRLNTEGAEVGGPSTRLRKRAPKVEESEKKPKEKQTRRKKVTNAIAAKVSAGRAKVKDEEKDYQCDIDGCNMSFGTKQELSHHKRNICPVKGCGKRFFSHKYLVQHRRVHEDDRPLKCPWKGCKMTFKWAWARTEHIRVHTGVRPYVCADPDCGQTFRFVSDFSRHKRKTGHSVKKSRQ